jgi:4-amino-4-deoxy-L-arabinose transferase-like glycosyltransferase|tara:strand:+ start:2712 stop:4337 length:1626 start_codon:yes stop_codon:yes gene_type:complete
MIIKFLKSHWLILLIILLAFILRFWGSWYGLPGLYVGDEKSIVGGALKMIYQHNIFPVLEPEVFRLLYYSVCIPWIYLIFFVPYAIFVYLTGDFSSLAQIRDQFIMDPSVFFMIARVISVLVATGAVFLAYLAAKKIFNKRAGIIAALLYGVSFLPVHQGHFSKHWSYGTFFGLLVLYFVFVVLENPSRRNYIRSGIIVGLAFFCDYIFALYGLLVVGVHFLFPGSFKKKLFDKKLWLFLIIALAMAILTVSFYPQEFYRLTMGEDSTATGDKSILGFLETFFEMIKALYYLATFIFIPALFGYVFLFFKDKKKFFLLIFIPLFSIILYYLLLHFEPRYIMLFLPILAVVAGFGLDQIFKFLKIKSNLLVGLIVLAIVFIPLKNAIVFDLMISQTDTRNLAKDWVEANIPKGSKIITNSWEFNLIKNQECLHQQQQINNMSLRSRDYVMMNKPFEDSYCVWQLDLIKVLPQNIDEYQYYLVDSLTGRRSAYLGELLIERGELIKKFEGGSLGPIEQDATRFVHQRLKEQALGPTIEIYKLK